MANKRIWLGILVIVLVFGITVIGCETDVDNNTHTHSYAATWSMDTAQHWHECDCGDKKDIANHTGDPCTVCSYDSGNQPGDGSEANPFRLIENEWTDGEFANAYDSQWFKFIATAEQQYIHVSLGAGINTSWGVYIQVYDSNGNVILNGNGYELSDGTYVSFATTKDYDIWELVSGDEYFIKSSCTGNQGVGNYRIGFTTSAEKPGTVITTLILNEVSDSIIDTNNKEQWFEFTATASTHYIHLIANSLSWAYAQLYDSDGTAIGSTETMFGGTTSFSRTTTIDQVYKIKVSQYGTYTGNFGIAFNTSNIVPGASWILIDSGYFTPNAITYGNGRFVAVSGTSSAAYSTSGTTWTEINPGNNGLGLISTSFTDIAYSNPRFLAVSNSGLLASSGDGISWSWLINSTFGSTRINATVYGNSYFVAVGNEGKAMRMYNSPSPGEPTAIYTEFGTSHIYGVSYGGSKFVAVGQSGKISYSNADGSTWTSVSDTKFGTSTIENITYGNGVFVAVGQSGKAAYSNDGITWTAINDMKFGTSDIKSIAYGGGKFVAVGNNGKAAYSDNGITWTAMNGRGESRTFRSITYGNGRFVAVLDTGMVYWITP